LGITLNAQNRMKDFRKKMKFASIYVIYENITWKRCRDHTERMDDEMWSKVA
jgi:hypothetical protein